MLGLGEDMPLGRGSSTTIGMMLMVGVVVMLSVGAVAGVFAVVLGPPPVAPQLAFEFDYTNTYGTDSLVIDHDFGDIAEGDLISITVHHGEPSGVDGSYRWDGATLGGDSEANRGSSVTLNETTIGENGALDLDDARVIVTWESADGGHDVTLAEWQGPGTATSPNDPGHAYLDMNENGVWDAGVDTKIPDAEVTDGVYDAKSDALVIPASVGSISADNIDFDGANITIDVELTATGNQDVVVKASETLTIEDVTVKSGSGRKVTLRGGSGVWANGTKIDSGAKVTVRSNNGEVHLSDGTIDATEKSGANVKLRSNGAMYLESTTIRTTPGGAADASLNQGSATLYIDDAVLDDGDDTLAYSPSDITVDGNPSSGSVTAG